MTIGFRSGHFVQDATYETRRPAGSDDWLLILSLAGGGRHQHGSKRVDLPPGTAILYGPTVSHWYGSGSASWELMWTHFPGDGRLERWLDWPSAPGGARILQLGDAAHEVERALRELVRWQSGPAADRTAFAFNALERALIWCDRANPSAGHFSRDRRVEAALATISDRLSGEISMQSVATEVGLSPSRLAHLFKATVGKSLPEYVEERRIERAEDLLRMTNRPVQEVARLVGYRDPLYFSRRFRRRHGMSPREWRFSVDGRSQRSPDSPLSAQEDNDTSALT